METVSSVGKGYYNYYEINSRYSTKDGKALEVWYDRDLSTEEINSNNKNSGLTNMESKYADICRNVADSFQSIAAANRANYSNPDEMKCAVWAKYQASGNYKHLTHEQRTALARTEINMTMFGYVNLSEARIVSAIKGDYTKNTGSKSDAEDREFNIQMLGTQIGNVLRNNGISQSLFGNRQFLFSVNGMTNKIIVSLLNEDEKANSGLPTEMERALNTNDNARKLFFNLLYDSNKQGMIPKEQLSKWKIYNDFKHITGMNILEFELTKDGFVSKDGRTAKDIYKEALRTTSKVPAEFKGDAFDYFCSMEKEAMKYNISDVPDLTLSLEYKNGAVKLPGDIKSFELKA